MILTADGEVKYKVVIDDNNVSEQLDKTNSRIEKSSAGTAGKVGRAFLGVAGVIGAAAVAAGSAALKIGMDFEAQMSRVQGISGATGAELNALSEQAIELGATTAFSATEAAEGMENLASAGFSVNEIVASMPGLLDLAASAGIDVASASDIAASSLRAFGLDADDAGHVADVFAEAAARTNAGVTDMGEAMKYVAPVANAMGISMEETAAAIGIMSDAGIKGGQAGTALRGALSRIAKPTDQMRDTMDKLGLSFYDAEGNMLSLEDQIGLLQGSFAGLTQEEQNQALITLYGQESLSGMLALMEAGPDKVGDLTESFKSCDGAAAEMAATMTDNLAGSVDGLMGQLETIGIQIYQGMEEPLKEAADIFSEFLATISEDGTLDALIETLSALGTTLSGALVDILPVIVELINLLLPPILELVDAILPELMSLFDALMPIIQMLAEELLKPLIDVFAQLLPPIMELVEALLPPLVAVFNALLEPLMKLISALLPPLLQLFNAIIPAINALTPVIQLLASLFSEYLSGAIQAVMPIIDNLISYLEGILNFITGVFTGNWELAWEGIKGIVKGALNAIPALVESAVNLVINAVNGLIRGVNALTGVIGLPAIPEIPSIKLPRFHTGGIIEFEGGAEEGEIIARRGEMILTEAQQAEVWNILESGTDMSESTPAQVSVYNNIVGTVEMDGRTVGQIVWENLDDVSAFN